MKPRPESDEALVKRMLPYDNPSRVSRIQAWEDWHAGSGQTSVLRFIQAHNYSKEPDDDILQEALLIAYVEVERGRYMPQPGVPFTAYVKGIARNKIREARRKERNLVDLDDFEQALPDAPQRQPEAVYERRELQQALRLGLDRLPAMRRQVLEGLISGLTPQEIAGRLAMSEELVRQHKCRALRYLRNRGIIAS